MVVGILFFTAGVLVTQAAAHWELAPRVFSLSDVAWAAEAGYLTETKSNQPDKMISQAEFLHMVMKRYGEQQPGLTVPKGAENHWAADVYALAKAKGVVDCSCQIKPDEPITTDEAVKLIMLGINTKANKQLTTFEEVKGWIRQDAEALVTYQDAATLIRKMDEMYRFHKLIPQEDVVS
ncbi:MAG: hypothetical protein H0Z34_17080 [Brevibacillus sp.]|nr:hypothetical protein [Brevibacillus sp.]